MSFTYTANGLRQTMSDVSGSTTYGYDNRNRLTQKQTPFGTFTYSYDNASDVLSIASSNANGESLTYTYDQLNRLSTVTDNRLVAQGTTSGVTTYNYDAVGNLQNYTYANGVTSAYSYDGLNRLTQMGAAKGGTSISNYSYTLGAAGNRLTVAELSGRSMAYGYDSLYRLTSEAVSGDPANHNGTTGYTYDSVGNRQQLEVNGVTANLYNYDADDRLGSDTYDNDGNTINSFDTANTYDFENHMVQHGSVTIVYDGDGNRVSETVGGLTTNYLVDTLNPTGYPQVVDELQSGTVTRTYGYRLERISENQIISSAWTPRFYGYDGHGSVRQLTNAAGAVTDTYDYDAFGNLINSTGSTPNNYLFAGEQYDPALSLYYDRARYLNTSTGRFWSMDTQEPTPLDPTSLHRYLYVSSNPVDYIDPTGLYSQQFGYDVEDVVEPAYTAQYGTNNVLLGQWSKLGPPGTKVGGKLLYRLMPDILDFNRNIWMEIKPLSISGITRAAASLGLYTAAFWSFGIYADTQWLQGGRIFTVMSQGTSYPTLVFNCGGILFYTTNQSDYNLFNEIAQSAIGFGISGAVGALAGGLVNALAGQGSEVQTINNLVQIGIKGGEAEADIDTAVDLVPAA